jgi:hypothetical protein
MLTVCQSGVDLLPGASYLSTESFGVSLMRTLALLAGTVVTIFLILVFLPLAIGPSQP